METISEAKLANIRSRFAGNLDRVLSLVESYDQITGGGRRRATSSSDLLRAAVVFLHAALEDLLRSLAEEVLPNANGAILAELNLSLPGDNRSKFGVDDLAKFRGSSIDEVIGRSIRESLERSSYNHLGDIRGLLRRIGLGYHDVDRYASDLAAMMNRRHWIVHRVDRDYSKPSASPRAQPIKKSTVTAWLEAVRSFGSSVLDELARPPHDAG